MSEPISRRDFVKTAAAATSLLAIDNPAFSQQAARKRRYAIVGTGDRATGMWGRPVAQELRRRRGVRRPVRHQPQARAQPAEELIGVSCPTFTNFDEMCDKREAGRW